MWFVSPLYYSGDAGISYSTLMYGSDGTRHVVVATASIEMGAVIPYASGVQFKGVGANLQQLADGWHHRAVVAADGWQT